jgi:Tol biopolymer transport system component
MAIRGRSGRVAGSVLLSLTALVWAWGGSALGVPSLTTLVSVASDGTQGNEVSWSPAISGNGRFVAFTSNATNLVPGDTNARDDVFVHDLQTGETTRVSVSSDGTQSIEGGGLPAISGSGRFVGFVAADTNLVPGDTNSAVDVFVHDRETGETTRVSVASDGTQGTASFAHAQSGEPTISADGRFVAFESTFSNLVPGDTATCASLPNIPPGECPDVFVHDRQTGETILVSVASDGTQANDQSFAPAISADGRSVAFVSAASNLVPGDTNAFLDVFVHDLQTGETTRVSLASDGTEGNEVSLAPSISADGRTVAFVSDANNLVPRDTNGRRELFLGEDVFVHDRDTGETSLVSMAFNRRPSNDASFEPSISTDGRFVAFSSFATNLVRRDTNKIQDVFVRDRETGTTVRASVASDGTQATGIAGPFDFSADPSISGDGRVVAFFSSATNLVPGDANGTSDVFVRELAA